jgi:cell wall-associated NlpC family hydrolase
MASERTPRPGGVNLPGMRNSALATAALTSVALLSQTAGATPATADEGPSREEVRQRIDNLYDRAETDTGTYNATRAAASPRKRAGSPADSGRGGATPVTDDGRGRGRVDAGPPRRQADPALDDVTRQWFDVARAKLGPTVPASLPADRRPAATVDARPARPASAPSTREPAVAERAVRELTAGSSAPALPPAPEAAPKALPAALPAAESGPSSLRTTKERIQRQLATARDLLTAHAAQTARTNAPVAAIESRPSEETWAAPAQETRFDTDPLWQHQPAPVTMAALPTMETAFTQNTPLAADPLRQQQQQPATTMAAPPTMETAFASNTPLSMEPPLTMAAPPAMSAPVTMDASFPMAAPVPTEAPAAPRAPFGTPAPAPFPTAGPLQAEAAFPAAATPLQAEAAFPTATPLQADPTFTAGLPLTTANPVGVAPTPELPAYETKATRALSFARAQIGKPCVWGASGPGSFDNAGLIQASWRAAGVELARTTPAQAASGTAVPLADTRVGDLVFFYDDLSHVGLYIGNGTMIHAPGPGAYIREESVFYAGESAIRGAIRPA